VFIQHIIDKKMNTEKVAIHQEKFSQHYQLDGVAVEDSERLFAFDDSLQKGKSLFISGVTPLATGFKKSKNVISESTMQNLKAQAKMKILEASEKIRRHDFPISPIHINSNHNSCKHCPFKDVCFRHQEDVRIVKLNGETEAENESN
jgi:ATP-dependent helicase/DNAse subunit B